MTFAARLRTGGPVVLDGATGTCLEAMGTDVANPLWGSVALLSNEGRAATERVHRAYATAGAELVIANSHNLSRAHVARYLAAHPRPDSIRQALTEYPGSPEEALTRWLNAEAVARARAAGVWVAGCLASPDRPYATEASLTAEAVADRLALQYEALRDAQPDLIIFEMLTTWPDIDGVCRLIERHPSPVGVAVGLVADRDGTIGGVAWPDAWARLRSVDPVAVFVQCTPFDRVLDALRSLAHAAPDVVLGAYANDGSYDEAQQAWTKSGTSPAIFAAGARAWVEAGARIVGGCCGTGPDHIRAIADAVAEPQRES